MKPAPFDYLRVASVDEACAALAADDSARLIAGGQTLIPLMAMRLAQPSRLIDIGRLGELSYIRDDGDAVIIGATTRHAVIERDPTVREKLPLLARAMPWVGHAATRARGTIGGSLANADPAAEIALVAVTLGATLHYRVDGRDAQIAADKFFTGAMSTALPAGACLTAVRFPIHGGRAGFHEVSARRSDFAYVSAAAQADMDDSVCRRLIVGIGAVEERPFRLDVRALEGAPFDEAKTREVLRAAMAEREPMADLHASADYRRRVAVTLALRAIRDACVTYPPLKGEGRRAQPAREESLTARPASPADLPLAGGGQEPRHAR
jgi:CO/xanthine dehydrogenase FAD-binding subunit